jgi:hypothetical protein
MRYTPFLDHCGVEIKEDVSDDAVNIIDAALAAVSATVDWGAHNGRKRKPCKGQPLLLAGKPIGQYHCESCGEMQLAGMAHMPPDDDYEATYGCEWPEGYVDQVSPDGAHHGD